MRPLFKLLLAIALIQPLGLLAKAGTSYTPSKSSSSNIGSKANKASATTQYSSTAIKPSTTIKPSVPTPITSVQSTKPIQSTSTATPNSSTTTTTNTTHIIERDRSNDSSIGIGGIIVGTAVGTMIGNSLSNHNQPTTVINNGQPQPVQTVQQSEYYQPTVSSQTTPTVIVQKQFKQQESSGFFTFLFWILSILVLIAIAFYFYKRKKTSLADIQHSVPHFMTMFSDIQKLSTLNNSLDKEKLIPLCTDEMFLGLTRITSENIEKDLHNIVDDITIISATIISTSSDNTGHYCSVKFNFKMKDYVLNNKNEVIHGSKDQYVNDIEVWTFKTTNYRTWKLSAIELYVK